MRLRLLGPLAVLLQLTWAAGGSAQSLPPGQGRAVAISDLIGLSPAAVRERIGARAPDQDYVSDARLTADGEVETRYTVDMLHGGGWCAPDSLLTFDLKGDPRLVAYPVFVFRDGRLQHIGLLPEEDPLLHVWCRAVNRGSPVDNILGLATFGPWAALIAAGHAPETANRAAARSELARLKLGEPPPGGLDAYEQHPPANVQVNALAPGRAVITVNLGRGRQYSADALVQAEVVDGRVAAIFKVQQNPVACWTESDRAFHCGSTMTPQ